MSWVFSQLDMPGKTPYGGIPETPWLDAQTIPFFVKEQRLSSETILDNSASTLRESPANLQEKKYIYIFFFNYFFFNHLYLQAYF